MGRFVVFVRAFKNSVTQTHRVSLGTKSASEGVTKADMTKETGAVTLLLEGCLRR